MALTLLDKKRISGVIKVSVEKAYYDDFFDQNNKSHYNDLDVLDYIVDLTLNKFKKDFSAKIITRYLGHIMALYSYCIEKDIMNLTVYQKLKSVSETYTDFINYNTDKFDKELEKSIIALNLMIETHNLVKDENLDALLSEQQEQEENDNTIKNYEKRIVELEKELRKESKKLDRNKEMLAKKDQEIANQKGIIGDLKKEISNLKKEITLSKAKCEDLEAAIESLKKDFNNLQKRYESTCIALDKKQKDYVDIQSELKQAKKENTAIKKAQEYERSLKDDRDNQSRKDHLTNERTNKIIIDEILKQDLTISEIISILSKNGIKLAKENVYQTMRFLQQRFMIDKLYYKNGELVYGINKSLPKPKEINLQTDNDTIDLLFISNLSLDMNGESLNKTMSYLYEYCVANNINYVFNIGSFFDIQETQDPKQGMDQIKELIEVAFKYYPKDPSIINFVLGGDKDINGLKLGLNPIDSICKVRSDIQDIGYESATILLGDKSIRLYKALSISDPDLLDKYLDEYYQRTSIKRQESFVDLIGSTSNGIMYFPKDFASIPSINNDEGLHGAYHLKVFLTHNNNNKILFIPLIVGPKVMQTARVVYQKSIIKK